MRKGRRQKRDEEALLAQVTDLPNTAKAPEARDLAAELAAARERRIRAYTMVHESTRQEAEDYFIRWRKKSLEEVKALPVRSLSWSEIDQLAEEDPALALEAWGQIKEEAREELDNGWRGARAMEPDALSRGPIDRARFLAVRESLREEWLPRPGMESLLVDMLAQVHALYEEWLGRHVYRMAYPALKDRSEDARLREAGHHAAIRVSEAEELDQTAAMADRWLKAYLRIARSLRDLRRYPVLIQNAGQVNVGQQQVNVAGRRSPPVIEPDEG